MNFPVSNSQICRGAQEGCRRSKPNGVTPGIRSPSYCEKATCGESNPSFFSQIVP